MELGWDKSLDQFNKVRFQTAEDSIRFKSQKQKPAAVLHSVETKLHLSFKVISDLVERKEGGGEKSREEERRGQGLAIILFTTIPG